MITAYTLSEGKKKVKSYNSLEAAVHTIGNNIGIINISGREDITSDLTVPSNVTIYKLKNA